MSSTPGGADAKAFLQELKTNRKTQAASAVFVIVAGACAWMLFAPDTPKKKAPRAAGAPASAASAALDTRQSKALETFPDLARLGKAGELPGDAGMKRDLFLFDGPPPPPKPLPPPPPPPPKSEAEIEAERLQAAKDVENGYRPHELRYIGFISSKASGQLAAFIKAEQPLTMKVGDLANPHWRLDQITDKAAVFKNLKFPDMRFSLEARDGGGGGSAFGAQPASNEF